MMGCPVMLSSATVIGAATALNEMALFSSESVANHEFVLM
jgi:hypothetical protein